MNLVSVVSKVNRVTLVHVCRCYDKEICERIYLCLLVGSVGAPGEAGYMENNIEI